MTTPTGIAGASGESADQPASPPDAQIRITCYCRECGQMIHAAETHQAPVVSAPGTFEIEIQLGVHRHECEKAEK